MEVIFWLIGFSLFVALIFLGFFIWSVRNGQYEDSYTPSVRVLFNDPETKQRSGNGSKQPDQTNEE